MTHKVAKRKCHPYKSSDVDHGLVDRVIDRSHRQLAGPVDTRWYRADVAMGSGMVMVGKLVGGLRWSLRKRWRSSAEMLARVPRRL